MRKVLGVGTNDLKGWSNWKALGKNDYRYRLYCLWKSMLARCYSSLYQKTHPTYVGCKVCEAWLIFSAFVNDVQGLPGYTMWRDNPLKHIALDKDIKGHEVKIYGPENCMFVTAEENQKESYNRCRDKNSVKDNIQHFVEAAKRKAKPIKCTHPDGRVEIYASSRDAVRKGGFVKSGVLGCCHGKYKQHRGCMFEFA